MAENKGKGAKGANYDEVSGVGTSQAGITGTVGNLNSAGRDGGVGMPPINDDGNRQNADVGQHGALPALGRTGRGRGNRQAAQGGSRSGAPELTEEEREQRENEQTAANPNIEGGTLKRH